MTACSAEPSPSAVTVNGCKATEADNGHLSSVEINGGGVAFAVKDSVSMTTSSTSGTMEDDDLRYGCCYTRPAWLQWINNIVGAVWFISLANCLQSLANGLYGVVLSTIERQFDLTSSQSSWIAAGYEMGPIPILILLSILGSRVHRPISLSLGLLSVSAGCILFFIPQFTTPAYRPEGGAYNPLCSSNRSSSCDDNSESLSYYLPVFVIARLLIGMGATPIITVGVNYMDDCSTKEKFAKYCGIFMAMSVIGPAIGFVFGAATLEIFTDFYLFSKDEITIDSSDPKWIGCWWLPYTVTAGLCLLNAIPMWGYPRDLPGAAAIRASKVTEAHNDDSNPDANQLSYAKNCAEFGALAKSVLTNPTYLALTLFASCDNFIIAGFTAFGPKYFEFGFSMSPTLAGIMFGIVLLPAGAGGTVVGGLVIEKLRLSCKQIIKIQVVLSALIAAGCFLFLLICESPKLAGVNSSYNASWADDSASLELFDTCNANCSCDGVLFEPVCSHDKLQYYSPCHAGCSYRNKTDGSNYDYFDCSCVTRSPEDASQPFATGGACSSGICTEAIIFLVGFFVAVFLIFCCITTNTSATLRCVTSQQTAFALGVQVLIIKILGTIPGPLMMGVAFDNTCVLWQQLTCSDDSGSCLFYDNEALSINFVILTVTIKCVSFIAMLVAMILYRPPRLTADLVTEVTAVDGAGGKVNPVADETYSNVDEKPKVNGTALCMMTEPSKDETADSSNGGFANDDGEAGHETSQL